MHKHVLQSLKLRVCMLSVGASAWIRVRSLCTLHAKCSVLCPVTRINPPRHVRLLHLVVFPGGEASEDAAQEDFQYKLKGFIDSTVDKR